MIKNKKPKLKLEEHSTFSTLRCGSGKKGFTLIEMLVAMAIFSTVMGIITGIFIMGIRQQKMALDHQIVLDQTSYALEYMSRALRFAKKQLAGDPVCLSQSGLNVETTGGGLGIKFINHLQEDDCQEFFLESNQIKYRRKIGQPEENTLPLTSNKLEVTSFKFDLAGEYQDDDLQPRITISSEIKSAGASGQSQKIQTSISQRNLDVEY